MSESPKILHHFVIEPLIGIGPIRLGMHKDEVGHAFLYPYISYFRAADCKVRSDRCDVVGLIIHYDDYGRVKQVEAYRPKDDSGVTLELYGRDVSKATMKEANELISRHTDEITREPHGFDFPRLGLKLSNHRYERDSDPVSHFTVGPPLPFDPLRTRVG